MGMISCPSCDGVMHSLQYEGITIESCEACDGEWLDGDELGKILAIRQVLFDDDTRRAVEEVEPIHGKPFYRIGRGSRCPKDGFELKPVNYGGNAGIILERCTGCGGMWLDNGELEKLWMVVEEWDRQLPEDKKKYASLLRKAAGKVDANDDVTVSRLPLVGGFINACVNNILDLTT